MNSQVCLALVVTLCLSNAAQTLGDAKSDATELIKQIKGNKALMDTLLRFILNEMADNHTSSEGTSTPTQPVTSQTTTKPLSTNQAVISQPTDTRASSKPLTSTQPVAIPTTSKETSTKPLSATQPLASQPTVTTPSSKPWTSTQAVVIETRTKETSTKSLSTTQPVASQTATNSNVPRNDNSTTEDGAKSDPTELIKQIKDNKALLDVLRLILKMADDHTSSEGTSTPTQPVTSQTTAKETSTKPLSTTQPLTSQPTVTTASSKPLTSTQPVSTQTTTNDSLIKPLSTTQPSASQTTTSLNVSRNDNNSTEGGSKDSNTTNEFTSFQQSHHSSNFPVFFMLILLIMVACYFAYHNRTKIHRFIKEGYGKAKQSGTAYVKVKLEDDIELTSEANRQYVY